MWTLLVSKAQEAEIRSHVKYLKVWAKVLQMSHLGEQVCEKTGKNKNFPQQRLHYFLKRFSNKFSVWVYAKMAIFYG